MSFEIRSNTMIGYSSINLFNLAWQSRSNDDIVQLKVSYNVATPITGDDLFTKGWQIKIVNDGDITYLIHPYSTTNTCYLHETLSGKSWDIDYNPSSLLLLITDTYGTLPITADSQLTIMILDGLVNNTTDITKNLFINNDLQVYGHAYIEDGLDVFGAMTYYSSEEHHGYEDHYGIETHHKKETHKGTEIHEGIETHEGLVHFTNQMTVLPKINVTSSSVIYGKYTISVDAENTLTIKKDNVIIFNVRLVAFRPSDSTLTSLKTDMKITETYYILGIADPNA